MNEGILPQKGFYCFTIAFFPGNISANEFLVIMTISQKSHENFPADVLTKAKGGHAPSVELLLKGLIRPLQAIARPLSNRSRIEFDDLLAEGLASIQNAIRDYNFDSKATFLTFALKYGKTAMHHYVHKEKALKRGGKSVLLRLDASNVIRESEDDPPLSETIDDKEATSAEDDLIRHETRFEARSMMEAALGGSRREGRETLRLLYVEGLTETEAAKRRGVSREAIRRTKDAAIERIRKYLLTTGRTS